MTEWTFETYEEQMIWLILEVLFWTVAVAWGFATLIGVVRLRWLSPLPPRTAGRPNSLSRKVTVVIAARDEEARMERTVRAVLAQQGVTIELIVVDDRSLDRTPQILASLAGEFEDRLRVIRIDRLPDRWLGKTHALHVGAGQATGQWILFTDADCWMQPDVIARAIECAERTGADHVCLLPRLSPVSKPLSLMTEACHLMFAWLLSDQLTKSNADARGAFAGIGAFNLVKKDRYVAIGGHLPLRLEVADDPMLGLLIHRSGGKTRAYLATGDIECDWASDLHGFVRILEKNYFAMFRYRSGAVAAFAMLLATMIAAGLFGPMSMTSAGLAAGLAFWSGIIPAWILARLGSWRSTASLLVPPMLSILLVAVCNSTWRTLRAGGVRWRDTFYPLDLLRAHCVQWSPFERRHRPMKLGPPADGVEGC